MDEKSLVRAAKTAAGNAELFPQLLAILTTAEEAVLQLGFTCNACGECCLFEAAEHMLLLSTGELALLASVPPSLPVGSLQCPYQIAGRCTARDRRPLGCRVFYCEKESTLRTAAIYEDAHRRIMTLHEKANIPYAYAEMTSWLAAYLRKSEPATPPTTLLESPES